MTSRKESSIFLRWKRAGRNEFLMDCSMGVRKGPMLGVVRQRWDH